MVIAGFIIRGSESASIVLRGLGPSLRRAGLTNVLANPSLQLYDINQTVLAQNDDWQDSQETEITNTGIAPTDPLESAIVITLTSGRYTAVLADRNAGSGLGLIEVYNLNSNANATFSNISTRGFVGVDPNSLIGGIITDKSGTSNLVVRALGPTLSSAGLTGVLQDPTLTVYDTNGAVIAANDNWQDEQSDTISSTGLAPEDNRESAIYLSLTSGRYTAIVRGKNGTSGIGLVEFYRLF